MNSSYISKLFFFFWERLGVLCFSEYYKFVGEA
jgi:hypothetical protein